MQRLQARDTFIHGIIPWQVGPKEEFIFAVVSRGKGAGRATQVPKPDIVSTNAGSTYRFALGAYRTLITC